MLTRRKTRLATSDAPAVDDVPEATDNGRVPREARQRIDERARWLTARLGVVVLLWFCYVLAVPILWKRHGAVALLLVPTAGVYLFTWLGYYRHELWHRYFPHVDNRRWFDFVSYLLFSDPQVYRLAHVSHHVAIHTPGDWEFFCADWTTDRARRRRQFFAELLLGNIAWELASFQRLWKARGASVLRAGLAATAKRAGLLGLVMLTCSWLEPGSAGLCLVSYALTVWAGSVMTRQNQWIEHLGIVSDGALAERNLLSRNLSSATWAGWLVNALNHQDAREHVFHHTEPRVNSRGVSGLPLPPGAQTVSLGDYGRLLRRYHRSLSA
jgi:hypothetical protein